MSVSLYEIRSLREQRKRLSDQAGVLLTRAHEERKSGKRATGLTMAEHDEFDRMHAEVDRLALKITKLDEERQRETQADLAREIPDKRTAGRADTNIDLYNSTAPGKILSPAKRNALVKYMGCRDLRGEDTFTPEELRSNFATDTRQTVGGEMRALSDVTGAAGAYTVPQGFVYTLEIATKWYGGIIEAAKYMTTEMGNVMPYPSMNDTAQSGEIIAENTQVMGSSGASETDPVFGVVQFGAYMFDSGIIKLPIQLVQDSAFDVEDFIEDALQTRIGRKLNAKCTNGGGTTEPTGVVGSAALGVQGQIPTGVSYNNLTDLEHALDLSYRKKGKMPRASWMFHDSTMGYIRKLTDNNGRPLFIAGGTAEGIQNAAPDLLMGYPYWLNNDMPQLGSTNKSVLFGDFQKYMIRRVKQMQIVRMVERYIDALQYGYLVFMRADGQLLDAGTHPIVYYQNSAT